MQGCYYFDHLMKYMISTLKQIIKVECGFCFFFLKLSQGASGREFRGKALGNGIYRLT